MSQQTFELGSKLGQGSYAEVRAVVSEWPPAERAVKVLPLRRLGRQVSSVTSASAGSTVATRDGDGAIDKALLATARREVQIWRSIGRHEHCVELVCAFERDGAYLIVMERCEGSLYDARKDLLEQPESRVAEVFRQMAHGLGHMHQRRIMHRDVKPENYLIGGPGGGRVKLCDFGLAAVAPRSRLLFGSCGTVPYMSPEMVGDIGHSLSTDVWSLGTSVYHLLFQELPYMTTDPTGRLDGDSVRLSIVLGVPAPSFALHHTRRGGSSAHSELAASFARALLRRCVPERRFSVQQVLRLPFLHRYASDRSKA